jgi:hypothetical protein
MPAKRIPDVRALADGVWVETITAKEARERGLLSRKTPRLSVKGQAGDCGVV